MNTGSMELDINSGLLLGARQVPSPNFDDRPADIPLDLLVIHNISLPPGQFGGGDIDALFCNRLDPAEHPYFSTINRLRVSSHLLLRRNGEVVQYVPFHKRAWHAGVSCFQGRTGCNDFSIGIELEGADDVPYDPRQYIALVDVIEVLISTWPGLAGNIVGHSDIAPGRKTDPGPAFDWSVLKHLSLVR